MCKATFGKKCQMKYLNILPDIDITVEISCECYLAYASLLNI